PSRRTGSRPWRNPHLLRRSWRRGSRHEVGNGAFGFYFFSFSQPSVRNDHLVGRLFRLDRVYSGAVDSCTFSTCLRYSSARAFKSLNVSTRMSSPARRAILSFKFAFNSPTSNKPRTYFGELDPVPVMLARAQSTYFSICSRSSRLSFLVGRLSSTIIDPP